LVWTPRVLPFMQILPQASIHACHAKGDELKGMVVEYLVMVRGKRVNYRRD
jgi:hypothetical protein